MPGTGICKLQFVNNLTGRVRSNGMSGKYNVANRIDPQVRPLGVDELVVIDVLFLHEVFSNFEAC